MGQRPGAIDRFWKIFLRFLWIFLNKSAIIKQMSEPLFSIITINYNNKAGLKKTMDSVLEQEFQDYEYIIIDGGSSDGSRELIESYLADPKCKKRVSFWSSEPDTGIYNAMNKGIARAKGAFVNLLNSGDAFCKNVLAQLAPIAKENFGKILYGAVNFYEGGKFVLTLGRSADGLPQNMIAHQSCFVPLELYKKHGPYDESYKITSDYEKFLRFYANKEEFIFTNLIIADYDNEGISAKKNDLVLQENRRAREKYGFYVQPKKPLIKPLLHFLLPGACFWLAKFLLKPFRPQQAQSQSVSSAALM